MEKTENTTGSWANILSFTGAIFVVLLCNKFDNIVYIPWKIQKYTQSRGLKILNSSGKVVILL